jgi:carboxylate-amine ligase
LNRIYAELAPYDPEGILCEEWVNSRGAIARFERNTIEIRLLDTQESPYSDLAIASLLVEVLKKLVAGEWSSSAQQNEYPTEALHEILLATIRDGDQAILEQLEYLTLLGLPPDAPCQAGWVWKALLTRLPQNEHSEFQELPLSKGCLAGRIRNNTGSAPSRRRIEEVYHQLCACLEERTFFE